MAHSFKLENNLKKNKKKDNSLLYTIIFSVIAVISIVMYFIINSDKGQDSYIAKADASKDYVYTIKTVQNMHNESDEVGYDKVPSINLKGTQYDDINNEIMTQYEKLEAEGNYIYYQYQFNQSDDILSLVIKYMYYPIESIYPIINFTTYNIDLVTGEVLDDESLLKRYNVTSDQIKVYLKSTFQGYYDDIIKNNLYTKKECNYDCFLKNRGITTNYLEDISFYVDDGKLTLFKYFYRDSDYNEATYFEEPTYQFLIKK